MASKLVVPQLGESISEAIIGRWLKAVGDAVEEATRDEVIRRDRDDATVAEFCRAAPGVTLLDSSDLTFAETVGWRGDSELVAPNWCL